MNKEMEDAFDSWIKTTDYLKGKKMNAIEFTISPDAFEAGVKWKCKQLQKESDEMSEVIKDIQEILLKSTFNMPLIAIHNRIGKHLKVNNE